MRALVTDPTAPAGISLTDVPDPVRDPAQVLVVVRHTSLSFGGVNGARSPDAVPGRVPGWDASGVVRHTVQGRRSGSLLGRRVLVSGASGGVGRFAVNLVADGSLLVDIGWRGSWTRVDEAVDALLGRRVGGEAILDVES